MTFLNMAVVLAFTGAAVWLINSSLPVNRMVRKILNVVVAVVVIMWLLNVFGIIHPLSGVHMG